MKKCLYTFLILLFTGFAQAQEEYTQTIKGKVVDSESQFPLIGATVALMQDSTVIKAVVADENGMYRLENIKIGRYRLIFQMLGYDAQSFNNVVLSSGKQLIYNVKLVENTTAVEIIEAIAYQKDGVVNEMAIISNRSFMAGETEKYAGSRQDPARMASNFAGVQGTDDSRNDIVIRGNSPLGLLWRLEDVDIPSPNHFSVAGSTGSPISVLNNKTIATSDFLTGAFSADYGNALSGVFDLKLRAGNNEKREFTGQFGIFGTEMLAEGPISKKSGSSYMLSYRYSTLQLFEAINFKLGTTAVPKYQDAAFKLNFPTKNKGVFSLWGIGGKSSIDIEPSLFTAPTDELYGLKNRDQYFRTDMGVVGFTHAFPVNETTFTKFVVAQSVSKVSSLHEKIIRDSAAALLDTFIFIDKYHFQENLMLEYKTTAHFYLNKKLNKRNSLKIGLMAEYLLMDMQDSIVVDTATQLWNKRLDYRGGSYLVQPYIVWKNRLSENLTMVAGIHGSMYTLNANSKAVEPRIGFRYKLKNNQSLSLGAGLHSQRQVSYLYAHQRNRDNQYTLYDRENMNIGLTRSLQVVLGYDKLFNENLRFKAETYYQYLYDIPVTTYSSSYAVINQGSGFDRFFPDSLENTGTGQNVGMEVTLEKFFSRNYFFMFTGSVFDSKYVGKDGVKRDTDFNGRFATNALFGYQAKMGKKKKNSFSAGLKITWAGGRLYGPVDTAASRILEQAVYADATRNSLRFEDYFRLDTKLGWKFNGKKVGHEIALDIINLLDRRNILSMTYDPDLALTNPTGNPLIKQPQLGRLPVFYYKIDF